jgi:RNA polymerase sigma-70 factor (ECF subfamily)
MEHAPMDQTGGGQPAPFDTTHWSVVLAAGKRPSPEADRAFGELCELYWYPVYTYVRRRLGDPEAAMDSTQEFFLALLERNTLAVAAPERGRFRTFLLTACQNFLNNQYRASQAVKRGGGHRIVTLDTASAESRFLAQTLKTNTPEREFERAWIVTLLEGVLDRLGAEYEAAGKGPLFFALRSSLTLDQERGEYAAAAAQLGMTVGAIKTAACRLRQRYRQLLRAAVSATVDRTDDVENELRSLLRCLS